MSKGPNLTFSIVEDLGAAIVSGKFAKKKSFPIEAELCVQYGASRSVVREAVKMLTAKGMLASRARQGTWIQPEEEWNLFDADILGWVLAHQQSSGLRQEFGEVQMTVECTAAALAAVRGSFPEKSAIERALTRMHAAAAGEGDPLKACIAFHVAVLQASGNRFLVQFRHLIETTLQIVGPSAKGVLDVEGHRKVCHAIVAADADAAYRYTRELIASVYGTNVPQRRARSTRPG